MRRPLHPSSRKPCPKGLKSGNHSCDSHIESGLTFDHCTSTSVTARLLHFIRPFMMATRSKCTSPLSLRREPDVTACRPYFLSWETWKIGCLWDPSSNANLSAGPTLWSTKRRTIEAGRNLSRHSYGYQGLLVELQAQMDKFPNLKFCVLYFYMVLVNLLLHTVLSPL